MLSDVRRIDLPRLETDHQILTYTGLEYSDSGVQAIRALLTLQALAGHLDAPGGKLFKMRDRLRLKRDWASASISEAIAAYLTGANRPRAPRPTSCTRSTRRSCTWRPRTGTAR